MTKPAKSSVRFGRRSELLDFLLGSTPDDFWHWVKVSKQGAAVDGAGPGVIDDTSVQNAKIKDPPFP